MHPRKIVARFILWALYFLSLIILLIDLRVSHDEIVMFYFLCNLTLVFRLLGCWFLPWIIHNVCVLYVIYYFLTLRWDYINNFNALACCVPVLVQVVLALHLVIFRPGRSKSQRACRVGFHALMGIMVIVVYYWMICFFINDSDLQCLLEMAYMFVYLCMILTPQFMTHHQAVMQASLDKARHMHLAMTATSSKGGLTYAGGNREQPRKATANPTAGTSKDSRSTRERREASPSKTSKPPPKPKPKLISQA